MNIQSINPIFHQHKITSNEKRNNIYHSRSALVADTVSFSGQTKTILKASGNLSDAFSNSYDTGFEKSKIIAKKFMDTISAVANEIEGIEFLREFYEGKVLKGKESFLSKLKRSGAAPLDQIRTTIFIKDIYDMSILTKFLKSMSERGYEVRMETVKRSGRKILEQKPDLDIRLKDVPEMEIKKLPEQYRGCVSKRLPSGLSDIQIRFVDKLSQSKSETPLEVIIMLGKESGIAKIIEEDDVYNYLRKLKNELHVSKITDYDSKSLIKKIKDNTTSISDILHNFISRPMYANAAAKDVENVDLGLKVGITQEQGIYIKNLLEGIRNYIEKYYHNEIKIAQSEEYRNEVQKIIKTSSEYKVRADKTVFVEDIINAQREKIKDLRINKKEDLKTIGEVQSGLQNTIKKYTLKN